jgi:NADH-quinone oxidoreductase subunit L
VGLVTALLTAYYMSRQVFMVFFGEERWRHTEVEEGEGEGEVAAAAEPGTAAAAHADHGEHGEHGDEPHESPWIMTLPLVVLAVGAVVGGALNLPFTDSTHVLEHWLEPVIGEAEAHIDVDTAAKVGLAVVAVIASLVGLVAAAAVYLRRRVKAVEPEVLAHAYYYDEAISAFVAGPGTEVFEATAAFDRGIIDGAVNGVATEVGVFGRGLRHIQSGFVRSYALGVAAGVVVVLGYFLTRLNF